MRVLNRFGTKGEVCAHTRNGLCGLASRSGGVSSVDLLLKLLFCIGSSNMPNRRSRPRGTLYNHEQFHGSNPFVGQPPRLEMPNPSVHFPLHRFDTSQRRSTGTKFDQQRGRRSPHPDGDALDEQVRTALERILLDHPGRNEETGSDQRVGFTLPRIANGTKGTDSTYFASYRMPVEFLIHSVIRPRNV